MSSDDDDSETFEINEEDLFDLNKLPLVTKENEIGIDEDDQNRKTSSDEPFVGQCFLHEEDAFVFYQNYAKMNGFSIRKGRSVRMKGERTRRDYFCHHEGKTKDKVVDYSKQQRNRTSKRCECKARMRITLKTIKENFPKEWQVTKIVYEHNHVLLSKQKMNGRVLFVTPEDKSAIIEDTQNKKRNSGEPYVGQCFLNEEDAFIFYQNYANTNGFSIRKGRSEKTKGERTRRDYFCHHEGKTKNKVIDYSKHQRNRTSIKCECKARMRITLKTIKENSPKEWQVSTIVLEHNHVLPSKRKSMDVNDNRMNSHYTNKKSTLSSTEEFFANLINTGESVSPSPLYTAYASDASKSKKTVDYSDPFAIRNRMQGLSSAKYGSVTKDIEDLFLLRKQMMMSSLRNYPSLHADLIGRGSFKEPTTPNTVKDVVMVDNSDVIAVSDDDDDEPNSARPFQPYRDVVLNKPEGQFLMKQFLDGDYAHGQSSGGRGGGGGGAGGGGGVKGKTGGRVKGKGKGKGGEKEGEQTNAASEPTNEEEKNVGGDVEVEKKHDKGEYVGVQSDSDMEESDVNFDGLADIWKEMNFGLESTKDTMDFSIAENAKEDDEECDHSFILKEDIGYVCRVCGVVERSIESIIEFQRPKMAKSIRTYHHEGRDKSGDPTGVVLDGVISPGKDFSVTEVTAHPRHKKQMKPHQVEGFNFLLSNLITDNPGGCILAHAPGSGKTFMLISFIQSFMAKYPDARPLVVLPRGILETWKKEFSRWQVENIPLYDCYSRKADNRAQQLEVLKLWANTRSILFLGYKQFSMIVCDNDRSSVAASCQEILLTYPSLLILDEGHTPRNKDTDVFTSVEKVQTPRKVILSGTLYQNHVQEVFNILNLVRPKFLKMEDSKTIKRRILSRVPIESRRNLSKKCTDNEFYDLVEVTLLKDENFKRKVTVIEDLREMTSKVLHYYKGDFLDELPGYVDFSVFLNLSPRQKREVTELKRYKRKFKRSSVGSAVYVHPDLKPHVKNEKERNDYDLNKIDELLDRLDEREGVKAKFFLNLLRLCESSGEKLLVFGNYLLPLKFLVKLTMKVKGWSEGKQIFMITGDHENNEREVAMEQFNNSPDAKVFFGSIKACGEGISLVGASRIIILDVHLNPSVTRQAIGRAFRPGQVRKVYTYRLIAASSPEEEDHTTCFRKESIAKMWFEWNEYCGHNEFEMETIDVKDCGDQFLETPWLNEDVIALSKRS